MQQNAEWPLNCSKVVGVGGKGDLGAGWILVIIPLGWEEKVWLLKYEFWFRIAGKPYLSSGLSLQIKAKGWAVAALWGPPAAVFSFYQAAASACSVTWNAFGSCTTWLHSVACAASRDGGWQLRDGECCFSFQHSLSTLLKFHCTKGCPASKSAPAVLFSAGETMLILVLISIHIFGDKGTAARD